MPYWKCTCCNKQTYSACSFTHERTIFCAICGAGIKNEHYEGGQDNASVDTNSVDDTIRNRTDDISNIYTQQCKQV